MGLVYDAVHVTTGRAVAVKLLRPELVMDPALVRRVSEEARLAVEASHPNVVEVLDAGADEQGIPYLILERLYGDVLEAWLREPLTLVATTQVLVPIMGALVALHRSGIVHRDIKPSNIFVHRDVSGRLTPKLLDFGIAKALESSGCTLTGVALGTPAYMAPEQAMGSAAAGPASDLWAMAVVFVRCVTGRLPFTQSIAQRVGILRLGLTPEDLSAIPEPVARVLVRALQLDPSERHASMAEFRSELLGVLVAMAPQHPWPNASTLGYDAEHWSLPPAPGQARAPGAGEERDGLRGRPLDSPTRTLTPLRTGLARSASSGPRVVGWVSLTLLCLLLAAYVNRREWAAERSEISGAAAQPALDSVSLGLEPLPEGMALPSAADAPAAPELQVQEVAEAPEPGGATSRASPEAPEPPERASRTAPAPAARPAAPLAEPASRRPAPRGSAPAGSRAEPLPEATLRVSATSEPATSEPATSEPASATPLGANRAPIIE
jgi:serine/threonine-protein kinase